MKTSPCNRVRRRYHLLTVVPAVLALALYGHTQAQDKETHLEKGSKRIYIRADKLVAFNKSRMFELIGNVKAVRGAMMIKADRLKVYPHETPPSQTHPSAFKNNVNKVVATGNVHITYGKFIATADRAVYSANTETIELTGKPTRVSQGDQSMTAKNMKLFIEDERVRVSGQGNERVKAVFNK